MKRAIRFLLVASIFVLTAAIFIRPVIVFLAKKQLKKVFAESEVYVRSSSLKPLHLLCLHDIEIKKGGIYLLKVGELSIHYSLPSLVNKNIAKVSLKDIKVNVDLPGKSILGLRQYLNLGSSKGAFSIHSFELSNMDLNLKSEDLDFRAKLSTVFNPLKQMVDYLDLKIESWNSQGLQLEKASLEAIQFPSLGDFYIEKIKYDKSDIKEVKSKVRLEGASLFLDSLSASALGGQILGELTFKLGKGIEYFAHLEFVNLDIDKFVKDFNLQEKFEMSGKLGGEVILKGIGPLIKVISGDLSTSESGGVLVVKDAKFLENMARGSGQSLDILVESFRNYNYNVGIIKLSLDKDVLNLDIVLEGQAGKRNLNIKLHDFKLIDA